MSQDVNKELLPCPFCSGKAELVHKDGYHGMYISCTFCGAMSDSFISKDATIKAWNTRPQAQASGEVEVERVTMAIMDCPLANVVAYTQARQFAEAAIAAMNPPATQSVKQFLEGVDNEELGSIVKEFYHDPHEVIVDEIIEHLIQLAGDK